MCSDCLQHCLTDDHCWCHRGQAPPPGDVTVTAPPPAEHLSHTDTRSDTGAGPDTCHTCAVKWILSHNIFCGTQDLSGDVSSGPLFLHLLLWLASLHPTLDVSTMGQKHSRSLLPLLSWLSGCCPVSRLTPPLATSQLLS